MSASDVKTRGEEWLNIMSCAIPSLSVEGEIYRVLRFELTEQLSELARLECELSTTRRRCRGRRQVLGKRAVFTLSRSDDTQTRSFAGTWSPPSSCPTADDVPTLRIEVAPALWHLGQALRLPDLPGQERVPDIVKEVLEGAGVPGTSRSGAHRPLPEAGLHGPVPRDGTSTSCTASSPRRGSTSRSTSKDDEDVVVFGDSPTGLEDIEGDDVAAVLPATSASRASRIASSASSAGGLRAERQGVRPRLRPGEAPTKLEASGRGSKDPGSTRSRSTSTRRASPTRASASGSPRCCSTRSRRERDVVHGETGSLTLLAGPALLGRRHPTTPLNQEYLVVTRAHRRQPAAELRALRPRGRGGRRARPPVELRVLGRADRDHALPARRGAPAQQVVPGAQTAMTTGPSGQEIHTDEHGRVKVHSTGIAPGKKDDTSSRWIRTSQVPTGGSMLLPRVGWEVTVRHVEGDPDRPFVMGRMYNALRRRPTRSRRQGAEGSIQTATTPGGGSTNEIRMDDTKGSEEMFINASKDMSTEVKNNATECDRQQPETKIGANQTIERHRQHDGQHRRQPDALGLRQPDDARRDLHGRRRGRRSLALHRRQPRHEDRRRSQARRHRRSSLRCPASRSISWSARSPIRPAGRLNHEVGAALVELAPRHRR